MVQVRRDEFTPARSLARCGCLSQSDNGGPSYTGDNHTANNFQVSKHTPTTHLQHFRESHPDLHACATLLFQLKGAKFTNWEGGIRVGQQSAIDVHVLCSLAFPPSCLSYKKRICLCLWRAPR